MRNSRTTDPINSNPKGTKLRAAQQGIFYAKQRSYHTRGWPSLHVHRSKSRVLIASYPRVVSLVFLKKTTSRVEELVAFINKILKVGITDIFSTKLTFLRATKSNKVIEEPGMAPGFSLGISTE